ncbi:Cobalamin synthase [Solidesulfovibrio carbinoliphilus subsp. oakridgensis]|uniref:Adenosylcobinamide-GDP ribazoletransferase n=1 Tax=Solidesulfovibrio carbinoliphilus subsp. oakridgensis TaxID=694327 RepID=G7Q6T3_9BACT|nr:adenosylcobinamide-GDP ribazoletransferase [Solidesulfovibrio carbinoliphilus]EHJ48018.1 Cobalamin synthase [Solidesulfovibrio carbinoliphilus subsp. oakridgensis]
MGIVRQYLAALGFLTRLGPAVRDPDMAACVPLFPVVGATLGLVLALPLALGLFGGHPLAGAFVYAVANLALTRGLHLDGFADVADAWGSLASGDRFFAIMKDSRIGAFGGMALVVALLGQVCLGAELLGVGRVWVLAFAPVLGRTGAVVLMRFCRDLARPGLGAMCLPGATGRNTAIAVAVAAFCGIAWAGIGPLAWGCLLLGVILYNLARLARKNGGINGDFLGAAIVAGELAALAGGLWLGRG